MNTIEISKVKVFKLILFCVLSIVASYFIQPRISNNDSAISVLVNVYSILAGILMAIITIIGDPVRIIDSKNWREAFYKTYMPMNQLTRAKNLFWLYLVTLVFIFLSYLLSDDSICKKIVEYIFSFCATLAILYSFGLPNILIKHQKDRLDDAVKKMREKAGIKD